MPEHPHLRRLSDLCLALPEATRQDSGHHVAFLVRKRTFAYFLDNHHGDGIMGVCGKVPLGENADLVAAAPERYYMPAYIGPRGWVGSGWTWGRSTGRRWGSSSGRATGSSLPSGWRPRFRSESTPAPVSTPRLRVNLSSQAVVRRAQVLRA